MNVSRGRLLPVALLIATLMLLAASASSADAMSEVRFLDAAPGVASARLEVAALGIVSSAGGSSSYGQVTPYAAAPSGRVTISLTGSGLHRRRSRHLTAGDHYTVIATGTRRAPRLIVLRDGAGAGGTARLRVIHVAPELGSPDISLDHRAIAQAIHYGDSTGYLDVTPGSYHVRVVSPRSATPIASTGVTLAAGTATTAFVIGTHGAPISIATASDATVTPGGPPETGLGGLAVGGGPPWLLIALAAIAGGAAAGAALRMRRRSDARR